jgi:hypothetical protein
MVYRKGMHLFLSIFVIHHFLDGETNSALNNNEVMLVSAQSRLKSDFEVIGIVGRGGFGHVFKVKLKPRKNFLEYHDIIEFAFKFRYKIN